MFHRYRSRRPFVDCRECLRKGEKPAKVRAGTICCYCADVIEGAF